MERQYPHNIAHGAAGEVTMIIKALQMISVLAAACLLGNWYLSEYRRLRASNLPWYRAYLTLPGIIIIVVIFLLPLIARHF